MHALPLYLALLTAGQLAGEAQALVDWLPPEDYCCRQAEIGEKYYAALQWRAATAASAWQAEQLYSAGDEAGRLLDWWNLALQAHDPGHSGYRYRLLPFAPGEEGGGSVWIAGHAENELWPALAAALCRERLGPERWSRQEWPPPVPLHLAPLWP
jgi:hypothetical protein